MPSLHSLAFAMAVLSVDLASRRYRDNGIALLWGEPARTEARLVTPEELGLHGEPQADAFAEALLALAEREGIRVILLDGPQGWRANESSLVHLRHCEREARAPGKTGLPGIVKPRTWTRMAEFSISLFDALHRRGWPRLTDAWTGGRVAIESFPTHAWRMLGETPLPGKSATTSLEPWLDMLSRRGLRFSPQAIGHDEVQALVAGLGGISLLSGGLASCDVRGRNPFIEEGCWREGFILSPRH